MTASPTSLVSFCPTPVNLVVKGIPFAPLNLYSILILYFKFLFWIHYIQNFYINCTSIHYLIPLIKLMDIRMHLLRGVLYQWKYSILILLILHSLINLWQISRCTSPQILGSGHITLLIVTYVAVRLEHQLIFIMVIKIYWNWINKKV